ALEQSTGAGFAWVWTWTISMRLWPPLVRSRRTMTEGLPTGCVMESWRSGLSQIALERDVRDPGRPSWTLIRHGPHLLVEESVTEIESSGMPKARWAAAPGRSSAPTHR